ncbi:type II toxin-antitoxin system prevent-host-death family antitoxin [Nocardioides sp.]|uniref:type II toxin-antitoxin system prevent-host-death family antitoxin n=1 Tax=Nocardioides sp. TaxID=35761 RepID=UPI0039E4B052
MKQISARELNQDVSAAKRAADEGPVIITDRGKPAYVLMTHADYRRLAGRGKSALEALRPPGTLLLSDEEVEDFDRFIEEMRRQPSSLRVPEDDDE